ncbi:hypothetical protein B7463_g4231, partial [Scytalidium lignicola]
MGPWRSRHEGPIGCLRLKVGCVSLIVIDCTIATPPGTRRTPALFCNHTPTLSQLALSFCRHRRLSFVGSDKKRCDGGTGDKTARPQWPEFNNEEKKSAYSVQSLGIIMSTTTTTTTGLVQVSSTPDIRLFYSLDGPLDGSRPIIALSSSLAADTHLWDDFVTAFTPQYTILRYDARFHGQSPLSSTPDFDYAAGHTIEDLASDVVLLLDHLHITKLRAFIGLSIGAAVALVFGTQHPERVEHVLVVGTKAENKESANAGHQARITYGRENGPLALGRQSISRWFSADWITAHPDKVAKLEGIVGTQSIEGFEASIAALRRLDLWKYADEVKKRGHGERFVFVAGEWDTPVVPESRQLAKRAGSRMVVVPESGHIVNVQQPESFYEVVREVIEK